MRYVEYVSNSRNTDLEKININEIVNIEQSGNIEWVFKDGKWVPVPVDKIPTQVPPKKYGFEKPGPGLAQPRKIPEEFDWDQIGAGDMQNRVIKIPTDRLAGGDSRYNIVIRPGDTIHVPVDIIGEFWIMGNVNAQGPFPLTGRPMTLKQAIATAGGLNPIAFPQKVEVIRRLGKNSAGLVQEEIVMVDLSKIAKGLQPDFFIKPYDLINVGTHGTSRWLAVLRNAFRATYGFGFVYDRNFVNDDFEAIITF